MVLLPDWCHSVTSPDIQMYPRGGAKHLIFTPHLTLTLNFDLDLKVRVSADWHYQMYYLPALWSIMKLPLRTTAIYRRFSLIWNLNLCLAIIKVKQNTVALTSAILSLCICRQYIYSEWPQNAPLRSKLFKIDLVGLLDPPCHPKQVEPHTHVKVFLVGH